MKDSSLGTKPCIADAILAVLGLYRRIVGAGVRRLRHSLMAAEDLCQRLQDEKEVRARIKAE